MPRRHGHPKADKPWERENYKSRTRRKRVGNTRERAKRRGGKKNG